jgi:Protein of unknown function (DUF1674)
MASVQCSSRLLSSAPCAHLFTQHIGTRFLSFTPPRVAAIPRSPFTGPSPPRLPKEDQDIFEELQRQSTGAFSTPSEKPQINQIPNSSASDVAKSESIIAERVDKTENSSSSTFKDDFKGLIEARGQGEELHPNVLRGAQPEFEGERNPKTGEVGGPKNEPLRWGAAGEWSYNGRTTDF